MLAPTLTETSDEETLRAVATMARSTEGAASGLVSLAESVSVAVNRTLCSRRRRELDARSTTLPRP